MLKNPRYKLVLLASLLVFSDVAIGSAKQSGSRWLVSPELLEAGKLKMLWENKLPIKESETLERLFILGNRIYALSNRNYMVCLNREKGNIIFSRSIVPAGLPVVGLQLYENELFSVTGGKLVEINTESGTEKNASRLALGVTCPAVRNSSYFYVAGSDRRIHALRAEDKVKVFEVAADNDSIITSVIADEGFIVFATDMGNVVSVAPDKPKRLWQFDATGGIVGPIIRGNKSLFFASKDTNVYKINILTGSYSWKYQTAAMLDKAPRVTQEVVYQYVHDKGLVALAKASGKFMWRLAEGADLLAEVSGKAYVITSTGKLTVMDNKKAKQLYSVNFAPVSRYVANMIDSKIYIADEAGRIACLKPIE